MLFATSQCTGFDFAPARLALSWVQGKAVADSTHLAWYRQHPHRHGSELPLEIERLWSTLAANRRNIIPVLDFLVSLGMHVAFQVRRRQGCTFVIETSFM